ncbi:hypothetical protein BDV06DRAFT_111287 [Aspergillus oleicola]
MKKRLRMEATILGLSTTETFYGDHDRQLKSVSSVLVLREWLETNNTKLHRQNNARGVPHTSWRTNMSQSNIKCLPCSTLIAPFPDTLEGSSNSGFFSGVDKAGSCTAGARAGSLQPASSHSCLIGETEPRIGQFLLSWGRIHRSLLRPVRG